jgi:hypothetical protein
MSSTFLDWENIARTILEKVISYTSSHSVFVSIFLKIALGFSSVNIFLSDKLSLPPQIKYILKLKILLQGKKFSYSMFHFLFCNLDVL